MLLLFGSNYTAVRNFFQENTVPEDYGVFKREMVYPEEEGSVLVVPANALTTSSDECLVELQKSVNHLVKMETIGFRCTFEQEILSKVTATTILRC